MLKVHPLNDQIDENVFTIHVITIEDKQFWF